MRPVLRATWIKGRISSGSGRTAWRLGRFRKRGRRTCCRCLSIWRSAHCRGVEDLPVDGVVLSVDSSSLPLDLSQLMSLSAVRCMFNKYLLVELPGVVGVGELRGLRDIGVDAVILDVSALSAEAFSQLQEDLLNLPRQRKPRASKSDAMLPRNAFRVPATRRQDDDDDDEDD